MIEWFKMNFDPFDLFMLSAVIVYRKGIYTAIAGENGVLQINEIAQALLLVVFYISVRAERLRTHEYQVFPEFYWAGLFAAIVAIAGIKGKIFHKYKPEEKEKPTN